jgi:hypothetical protein
MRGERNLWNSNRNWIQMMKVPSNRHPLRRIEKQMASFCLSLPRVLYRVNLFLSLSGVQSSTIAMHPVLFIFLVLSVVTKVCSHPVDDPLILGGNGFNIVTGSRRLIPWADESPHINLTKRAGNFYLRLMPLGASITQGVASSDGNGYRKWLRDALRFNGWQVNMVGTAATGRMKDKVCKKLHDECCVTR